MWCVVRNTYLAVGVTAYLTISHLMGSCAPNFGTTNVSALSMANLRTVLWHHSHLPIQSLLEVQLRLGVSEHNRSSRGRMSGSSIDKESVPLCLCLSRCIC